MKMPDFPFLQLMRDVGPEFETYVESSLDGLEEPLLRFGPVARVNIFVGATNSGKSRFLRGLAKSQRFIFLPSSEVWELMQKVMEIRKRLANSQHSFSIRIDFSPYDALPSIGPRWLQPILHTLPHGFKGEAIYDAEFFADLEEPLMEFFQHRLDPHRRPVEVSLAERLAHDADILKMDSYPLAIVATDALEGDHREQQRRLQERGGRPFDTQYEAEKGRLNRVQRGAFTFSSENSSLEFEDDFITFFRAIQALRETPVIQDLTPKRVYIPTLRSAISLRDANGRKIEEDLFASTVRHNYSFEDDANLDIFTGGDLYATLQQNKLALSEVRGRLEEFEQFLSETFFDHHRVTLTALHEAHSPGKHINIEVKNQFERDLHHVGEGIGTLIVLMYRLFLAEPGSWIFIEEPELNLHPGLQHIFLETLINDSRLRIKNLSVFFTTHSNHLLRLALPDYDDVSVWAFQRATPQEKHERFAVRSLLSGQSHALTLLGVTNTSVLLANCGVWVEGVTDRLYLRAYLQAWMNSDEFKQQQGLELREDLHFAFWEYAGSNLAHYLFEEQSIETSDGTGVGDEIRAAALCSRIFLLADRDMNKDKKHERLRSLERDTLVYCVTPGVEVENLISERILRRCLPQLFRISGHEAQAAAFNEKSYKNTRMGVFLKKTFGERCPTTLAEKSGTLSTAYKNKLAELVAAGVKWEDMSDDARAITRRLYEFIARFNGR